MKASDKSEPKPDEQDPEQIATDAVMGALEGNPNLPDVDITSLPINAEPRALKATWSTRYVCGEAVHADGSTTDLNGCCATHGQPDLPAGWIEAQVPTMMGGEDAHVVRFCPAHRKRVPNCVREHIPPPLPGHYRMVRRQDITGISGIGHVANWVIFDSGRTVVEWCSPDAPGSLVAWDDVEDALHVHLLNHPGRSYLVSDDGEQWPPAPCDTCKGVGQHRDGCTWLAAREKELREGPQPMSGEGGIIAYHLAQPTLDPKVQQFVDDAEEILKRETARLMEKAAAVATATGRSLRTVLMDWMAEVGTTPLPADEPQMQHDYHHEVCRRCHHVKGERDDPEPCPGAPR